MSTKTGQVTKATGKVICMVCKKVISAAKTAADTHGIHRTGNCVRRWLDGDYEK